MSWRKWIVRVLVFAVLGGMAAAGFVYFRWTNPEVVRRQVLDKLTVQIPGADVTVESAYLRLLSGIAVSELRLVRRDDPDKIEFARFPSSVIYHDKEQLTEGKLAIRKLELQRPRLRLIRGSDGRWNIAGIFGPAKPGEPLPAVVIRQGTLVVEDLTACPALPALEITDIHLTVLNDPPSQVTWRGGGKNDLLGDLRIHGSWHRESGTVLVSLEAPAVTLGSSLLQRLAVQSPKLAEHAKQLEGTVALQADIAFQPGSPQPWSHVICCQLHDGKLIHPQIPLPLHQIEAAARYTDGELKLEHCNARSGATRLELTGWARARSPMTPTPRPNLEPLTPEPSSLVPPETDFEGDLKVVQLPVDSALFTRLPHNLRKLHDDYAPIGLVDLDIHFACTDGQWKKRFRVQPQDLTVAFCKFPYPLEHVTGTIDLEIDTQQRRDVLKLDLAGGSGPKRVYVKGETIGPGPLSAVDVKIWGEDIPLDDKLRAALSPKFQKLARAFHPQGLLNFQTFIRRDAGVREFHNRYLLTFHHASLRYAVFPYPLENVTGTLDIQEQQWEFHDFRGTHKEGEFHARGRNLPAPQEQHFLIEITGQNALLDAELESALEPGLKNVWKLFQPSGRMNFRSLIEGQPDQPPEVDLTVTLLSGAVKPRFFPYALQDVRGSFRYAKRWVYLDRLQARHGASVVTLDGAKAFVKPEGGFWADLVFLRGNPLVVDEDLLQALPAVLSKVCRATQLKGPIDFKTHLTIDSSEKESADIIPKRPLIRTTEMPVSAFGEGEKGRRGEGEKPEGPDRVAGAERSEAPAKQLNRGFANAQPRPPTEREGEKNSSVIFWDGEIALRDATVQAGVQWDHVTGKAACRGRCNGQHLEGLVGNLLIDEAVVLKQPFRVLQGQFEIPKDHPHVLVFPGLKGKMFGGEVYGPVRIEFEPALRYELNLTASQVKLEEFGRHNFGPNTPVSGLASAGLYLTGTGTDVKDLKGNGNVDIPKGKLYHLPLLLDLLKFLGLRLPDRTAFEEAHATFTIQGKRMVINRIDLFGNSVSLRGHGETNLDGSDIDLEFYAVWARIVQFLPPLIKDIPPALSKNLLKIKMKGQVGNVRFTKEPIPIVVEPLKELLDTMAKKQK